MSNIINYGELAKVLQYEIDEIRKNTKLDYVQNLESKIKELYFIVDQQKDILSLEYAEINDLIKIYHLLQDISLILKANINNIQIITDKEKYNKVEYGLFYKDKMLYSDNINIDAAITKGSKQLYLNLNKAFQIIEDDLKKVKSQTQIRLLDLFNDHFQLMLNTVIGSYNRHHSTPWSENNIKFNRGHVFEAHERHLKKTHGVLYKYYQLEKGNAIYTESVQNHFNHLKAENELKSWYYHESVFVTWENLKESLGNRRGTVGADVGYRQMKFVGAKSGSISLSPYANLINGVLLYLDLFDPNVSSETLSKRIALYIAEPVERTIQMKVINQKNDPLFQGALEDTKILEIFDEYKNLELTLV